MYKDLYSEEITKKLTKLKKKTLCNIQKSVRKWTLFWKIRITVISSSITI